MSISIIINFHYNKIWYITSDRDMSLQSFSVSKEWTRCCQFLKYNSKMCQFLHAIDWHGNNYYNYNVQIVIYIQYLNRSFASCACAKYFFPWLLTTLLFLFYYWNYLWTLQDARIDFYPLSLSHLREARLSQRMARLLTNLNNRVRS